MSGALPVLLVPVELHNISTSTVGSQPSRIQERRIPLCHLPPSPNICTAVIMVYMKSLSELINMCSSTPLTPAVPVQLLRQCLPGQIL